MKSIKFLGKNYILNSKSSKFLVFIMIIFLIYYFIFFLYYGAESLSYFLEIPKWLSLVIIVLATFSIKIKEFEFSLFSEGIKGLMYFVLFITTFYFLCNHEHFKLWKLVLISFYPIVFVIERLIKLIYFLKFQKTIK